MSVVTRVLVGLITAGVLVLPTAPAFAAPAHSLGESALANEFEIAKPKKTVTVKCYLMNLQNEATGEVIYGTGKSKAEAQADANTKVPRGHKLKHCDIVR